MGWKRVTKNEELRKKSRKPISEKRKAKSSVKGGYQGGVAARALPRVAARGFARRETLRALVVDGRNGRQGAPRRSRRYSTQSTRPGQVEAKR